MKLSRRNFLGTASAAAFPFIFPGCSGLSARRYAANEKVNIGVIGIGRISTTMDIPLAIKYTDLCRFTAVCDLDSKRLAHGVDFIRKRYGQLLGEANAPVKTFADYHDLLDDPSIDAVEICIPDHWHTLVACAALAKGKHIWLQKPFSQTITEGRIIANLAKLQNRVVQVGSWQRSKEQFHRVCELAVNGRIGDIAQWGLGMDGSGPESVTGTCEWMDTSGGKLWNVHTTYDLHYSYNGGKTDVHVCDKYPMGIKFIGSTGEWLYCMRGAVKVTPSDPDVPANGKMQPLMASKNRLLEPMANPERPLKTSSDHWKNWLDAIRAGDPTMTATNAEAAQRSSTACCLGQMCMELGRGKKDGATVKWCAKKEDTCCPKAKELMKPFARGRYNLKDELARYGFCPEKILRG